MQCHNCKIQLPEKAKFCANCGAKVNVRLCPNGHVIEPGEKECRYCPSSSESRAKRMSVSTTIDKNTMMEKSVGKTTMIEKPVGKTTVVEIPPGKITVVEMTPSSDLNKTSIFSDPLDNKNDSPESAKLIGWLVITEGKELWKTFPITKTKISIGRSLDCDIAIDDEHLSAKHASLRFQNDVLFITDLDSSNGTYVNGQEVSRCELSDNDIIKIGNASLKFKKF